MDVFLMIRRKKTTIFTDAKDNTTVLELKKIIEVQRSRKNDEESEDLFPISVLVKTKKAYNVFNLNLPVTQLDKIIQRILKISPLDQQLYNKDQQVMLDSISLSDYGLTSATAKAQCPALVGLALRQENGQFEPLEITPYSLPPDLPDVMKSQEANGQEVSP